jgi:hypothetical protein
LDVGVRFGMECGVIVQPAPAWAKRAGRPCLLRGPCPGNTPASGRQINVGHMSYRIVPFFTFLRRHNLVMIGLRFSIVLQPGVTLKGKVLMQHLSAFPTQADRRLATALVITAIIVLTVVIYFMWRSPAPPAIRILIGTAILLITWTVGSMPFSYNELTDEGIILRQGWYFRTFIPYSNINSVTVPPTPAGLWPPGVRREQDGNGLRVVLSRHNLIKLELRNRQRFVLFGIVPVVTAERVMLNVPEPEETAQFIESRLPPSR